MKWFIFAVLAIGAFNILSKRIIEIAQDIERSEARIYNILFSSVEILVSVAVFGLAAYYVAIS